MKKTIKAINLNLIKDYISQNNLTIKEFCKLSNISTYRYHKIMSGDINFDIRIILRFAEIMNIEIIKFFILS